MLVFMYFYDYRFLAYVLLFCWATVVSIGNPYSSDESLNESPNVLI